MSNVPASPSVLVNHQKLSATGEQVAGKLGQFSWALFEFARSPYLVFIYIYVFAPYFANVVIGDAVRGQELWSFANTLVGLLVALIAPILGAIADRAGRRKPWLVAIVVVMAPSCVALWWAMPGGEGGLPVSVILMFVVILAGCFLLSEVFHNAMLPSLVCQNQIGKLSGLGIATNNIGALLVLCLMLYAVALPASDAVSWSFLPEQPLFGLDPLQHEHDRIGGPVAGIWLILFTLPLLMWTPDRATTGISYSQAIRDGFSQLQNTIRYARRIRNVVLYLLARMLYNDGKVAALAYAGLYAAGIFGWQLPEMLLCAVVLTPFAIVGGFIGGWLDTTFGSKRAIQISVGSSALLMLSAVSITSDQIFFFIDYSGSRSTELWSLPYFKTVPEVTYIVVAMILSISITSAFTNSRTMMARIAPVKMINQFYGLYALSGTATAFLGHAMVGFFTHHFQSQRAGFASLIILLVAGLSLMRWVKEERAQDIVT